MQVRFLPGAFAEVRIRRRAQRRCLSMIPSTTPRVRETIEAPAVPDADPRPAESGRAARRARWIRRHPWWIVAVALVAFSTVLVVWADTRPGYDPYGWLIWGYQTLHLNLDLGGAPSWKPLTWLFTVPYSLFGHFAAVAVDDHRGHDLAVRRDLRRPDRLPPDRRQPRRERRTAGDRRRGVRGARVLGIQNYFHYVLSVQSDPMIVSLCLGAIDCHLSGHPRWAFALGVLVALGRPEVWPFLGLYAIWLWRKMPSMRWIDRRRAGADPAPVVRASRRSPTPPADRRAARPSAPRASCTRTRSSARSTASPR